MTTFPGRCSAVNTLRTELHCSTVASGHEYQVSGEEKITQPRPSPGCVIYDRWYREGEEERGAALPALPHQVNIRNGAVIVLDTLHIATHCYITVHTFYTLLYYHILHFLHIVTLNYISIHTSSTLLLIVIPCPSCKFPPSAETSAYFFPPVLFELSL